jgi:hypothetical protein
MVFLLVWDKDSYIRRFLVLFPCICILQHKLVHLYQTSSLLPSPLPKLASVNLRLQWAHQLHLSFRFPSLLYSSRESSPLSVWPCPIILLHLF